MALAVQYIDFYIESPYNYKDPSNDVLLIESSHFHHLSKRYYLTLKHKLPGIEQCFCLNWINPENHTIITIHLMTFFEI